MERNPTIKQFSNILKRRTTNTKELLLVVLAFLCLANLFFSMIPSMIFVFLILFVQFYSLNKYESAFLFSLFAASIGTFFAINGIRGIGSVFLLFAFIIIGLDYKYIILQYIKLIIPLVVIFILFVISVLSTEGGDFAKEKLFNTIITGLMCSFAFAHFFYYRYKYRPILISVFVIIYAFFTIKFSMEYYDLASPKNLLEFGYIRNMLSEIRITDFDIRINYQGLGFMGALALSFIFFENKLLISKFVYVLIYLLAVIVVLYSGSRQALLTLFVIISLDILRNKGRKSIIKSTVIFILFFTLVLYGLESSNVWFITDLRNTNDIIDASGRSTLYDEGFKQFTEHPITGVGYGRYINPDKIYGGSPHNMFVELLAETGILGVFVIFSITLFFIIKHFSYFKVLSASFGVNSILIVFFIRSLVSADLSINIEFFSILFLIPLYYQNIRIRQQLKMSTK
ncbi:MAG: O-antigen ligase family protein [Paludibacter sp.]|nr:O-antigen ligase family protein [Paludibacter sp.]